MNQALGVAEALGLPFALKRLGWRRLASLPNALLGASLLGVDAAFRASLAPPWPALAIAAGRRAAPVLRWLKGRSPATLAVQLMWPGSASGLDLVIVPAHDRAAGRPGIVTVPTVPHRLTPQRLRAAAEAAEAGVARLPRPRIACLVGGASRRIRFTADQMRALAAEASALARSVGGALLVTTSRRTGTALEEVLARSLSSPHRLHRFSCTEASPYEGWLGLADRVVVTGDSASLVSEACAVGRPVHLFRPPEWRLGRLDRLHESLAAAGRLTALAKATSEGPWRAGEVPPLNPAGEAARAIRTRAAGRPWQRAAGDIMLAATPRSNPTELQPACRRRATPSS
ncbi:MAG TPA: mitochondrial fission ELM1 family protein [Geminicoccaceae bacterium]|nr:mitochondrial fission ELM1 family protein [Geminicoccaceae bacterium]